MLKIYKEKESAEQTPFPLAEEKLNAFVMLTITDFEGKGNAMQKNNDESNETLVASYQAESDKTVKNALIGTLYQRNLGLIKTMANKYRRLSDFDVFADLVQEGYFAIMSAADVYDADQGTSFATYAALWLKQTMLRYIYNYGSGIRCPEYKHNSLYKLSKIVSNYAAQFGQEPSDKELCSLLGIDQKQLEDLKSDRIQLKIGSLDAPIPGEEDASFTLSDTVADDRDCYGEVIEVTDNEKLSLILWDEVSKLSPREEAVILKRFREEKTLDQVGSDMNITPEGVRCIQAKAMRKLRQSKIINQYREDVLSHAYIGTGLASFRNTGTSSTEKTALMLYQRGLDKYIKYLENDIRRIEKKYNIELDDGYRQLKIDEYKRTHPTP